MLTMSGMIWLCADFPLLEVDETGSLVMTANEAAESGLLPPLGISWAEFPADAPVLLHVRCEEDLGELVIRSIPSCQTLVGIHSSHWAEITLRWTPERGERLMRYLQETVPVGEEVCLGMIWLGDGVLPTMQSIGRSSLSVADLEYLLDPSHPGFAWNRGLRIVNDLGG